MLNRRAWFSAAAVGVGAGMAAASLPAWPQEQRSAQPARSPRAAAWPALDIYIPAGSGGGWDQTGRALGAAMQAAGLVKSIDFENKGGKGGTVGLADFGSRHEGNPHALLVGGLVMLGALALERTPQVLRQLVAPVARLTGDTMVICSTPGRHPRTLEALVKSLRRDVGSVRFTGGSAGGVDHMLAAMVVRALGLDAGALRYLPTTSGKEAHELLATGQAQVAISGYSEFKSGIQAGRLLPLATSSRKGLFGIPSLREQGVDTELSNWRGVFAPAGIDAAQRESLRRLVAATTATAPWRDALSSNNWQAALLVGRELDTFIEQQQWVATTVATLLKLSR